MAVICTSSVVKGGPGCGHRAITVDVDGQAIVIPSLTQAQLDAMPWGAEEKQQLALLTLKRKSVLGVSLSGVAGMVISGDEATNVKQYTLLTKDVTKTNIGTAYVNVSIGANGERTLADFTGCTEFRLHLHMNFIGLGPMNVRVVKDADNAVLYTSLPILVPAGEKEVDSGWLPIPSGFTSLEFIRLQGKSTTAADDPIFRKAVLLVR